VNKPVVQVVIASTRPGRIGPAVATWVRDRAEQHGGFTVELVDLAAVDLPLLDEPNHPRKQRYVHQHTKDWSATVSRADAFVFVMPEYNHGFNAALKNALDYLYIEWGDKPAGLVSYGGVAGGTRAAQLLKPVLTALRMVPVLEAVNIPFVHKLVADGRLQPSEQLDRAADGMFAALARWTQLLRSLRDDAGHDAAAA
jgi:NAD(P)H-dependent FMN reductase